MIVSNISVIKTLRKMLLDGLAEESKKNNPLINSDTKIAWENKTPEKNYKGIFLQEYITPVTELPSTNDTAGGSGFYRIIVWADKNTGFTPLEVADTVANFFNEGAYTLTDSTSELYIDYKTVGASLSDGRSDKIYVPITIYYRKFE